MKKLLPLLLLLSFTLQGCQLRSDENLIDLGILVSAGLAIYSTIHTIHGIDIEPYPRNKKVDEKRPYSFISTILWVVVCAVLWSARG